MKKTFLFALAAIASMAINAQTYYATVTPSTVQANGKSDLWFNLINEGIDFTAVQFYITLPEGFEFNYTTSRTGVKTYSAPTYSEDRTAEETKHIFDDSSVSDEGRTMLVIGHSSENADFYNTTYPGDERTYGLIKFAYVAHEDVAPGLYKGQVTGIVFATKEAVAYKTPDVEFSILVTGDGSTVTLDVSQAGIATLMLPFAAALPAGLQAWQCESVDENGVVATTELSSIPAHTPLMITGTPGTYEFNGTPDMSTKQHTAGVLTGTYELVNLKNGYVLQNHGGNVAFYRIDSADGENILPYRCYLTKPGTGAQAVTLNLDRNANGINSIILSTDGDSYDLSGRKSTRTNGMRIVNHTKVMSK